MTLLVACPSALAAQVAGSAADQVPDAGPDPQLVFAASRYAQTATEAPASVSLITREEIERFGYRTFGEILGAARGFFTSFDRNYTYVTVRGLARQGDYNTRILLLVDGHRLNDASSDNAYMGTESAVDVDAIERVEIIRGPGSSLFGTNAFYAVVNVITRQGRSLSAAEARVEGSSYDSYRGTLGWGRRFSPTVEVFATGSVYRSGGQRLYYPEFDDPATNSGIVAAADSDRTEKGLAKVRVGDFTAEAAFSRRRKLVPTASYGTDFNDPREQTSDRQAFAALNFEHPFEDLSRLWVSLTYNTFRYDGTYPYSGVLSRDYTHTDWYTLEAQYLRLVGEGHSLTAGGELRWNRNQDQGVYDVDPAFTYLDDRRSSWVGAGFVQASARLASAVQLYAGVRHDRYQGFGGTTNPRAALVAAVGPGTSLKALYGRAFRAPNQYEQFYNDGGLTQKPANPLRPERIETFELEADQALASGVRATASIYHLRVRNLIGIETDSADGLLVFRNVARAHSTGGELAVEGRLGPVDGRVTYGYQHAEDVGTDGAPVNSPRHLARLGASLPTFDGRLRASLELRYVGERPTVAGGDAASYTLTNVTLLARPWRACGCELSGSVYNLFRTRYADPGGEEHTQDLIPQDGRTFRLGARASF
jgi:iron complex outermembrane receptor protein